MYSQKNTNSRIVVKFTDSAVFSKTGKHLSNIETMVLQGTWKGLKYPQIAAENGYTIEYLKNDIGPKLWKRLSETFGEKIKKANVKVVLQRRLDSEEKIEVKTEAEINNRGSEKISSELTHSLLQQEPNFSKTSQENIEVHSKNNSNYHLISNPIVREQILPLTKFSSPVRHNLPCSETRLIGREFELQQLLKWLSSEQSIPRISIEGMGGIGKTHLLLEAVHQYLQTSEVAFNQKTSTGNNLPVFEQVIFTSAQSHYCTIHGFLPRFSQEKTLEDILRTILHTLNVNNYSDIYLDQAYEQVLKNLVGVRTLLIIDSLDKIEKRQEVLGFLYGLPSTVKIIVTSRKKTLFPALHLNELHTNDALSLIHKLVGEQRLSLSLEESQKLYQITGNIPAVIVHAISLLASGYRLQDLSLLLARNTEEFAQLYDYKLQASPLLRANTQA
ncbi:MAG: hypothetical protein F6K36_24585 [Symploca sp. SIO3C6]|uniref:Uncharacterized protein n=1 Tax=Symploca sp. SIO1C4 TaxID=2607765 RepID=A0A6B3NFL3_9CYAN|nr:hypothetical protein [Symploca sp. SIO3C6]NER28401.1 hypothetical protein [Symploca sp. SIO1C4]